MDYIRVDLPIKERCGEAKGDKPTSNDVKLNMTKVPFWLTRARLREAQASDIARATMRNNATPLLAYLLATNTK